MINIDVWSQSYIEIESKKYEITDRAKLLELIEDIINKVHYCGETICLEMVDIEEGKNVYQEIGRWP